MDWNNFIYTPKPNKKLANSKDARVLTSYQLYVYNALLYIREIYAERIQSPSHYLISKDILYDIVKNTPTYTTTYTMITTNSSNNKYNNNSSNSNSSSTATYKKYNRNSNSSKYKLNLHLTKGLHPIFKQPPDSQIHIDFNHIYTTAIQEATDLNLPNRHIPPSDVSSTGIGSEDMTVEEGIKKYINIRQRIAEVYGEHTANHILPMHMIKKLAGDERYLDEVTFPYRRELIRKVEAELRSSPGEVRSGPGEVRSAGNIL